MFFWCSWAIIVCWCAIEFSSLRRTVATPSHFLAMISVIHQKLSALGALLSDDWDSETMIELEESETRWAWGCVKLKGLLGSLLMGFFSHHKRESPRLRSLWVCVCFQKKVHSFKQFSWDNRVKRLWEILLHMWRSEHSHCTLESQFEYSFL